MPKSSIEELVEAALYRLSPQHTEQVTHDLFAIIEEDPVLLREYDSLCEQYQSSDLSGPANVNRTIGSWVRKKTGRSTLSSGHPSTRSSLIKTWSRLG